MCKYFKKIVTTAIEKGGVLAAGLGCLYLYKKKIIPKVLGPVSYGIISVGTISVARFFIMSVQAKQDSGEEQNPGEVQEEIPEKLKTEMRKEDILEKLRQTMADKQAQKGKDDMDKLQNPQSGTSSDEDQQPVPMKQPVRISVVEQHFSGYEECLKSSDSDVCEDFEIKTEEEFEVVSKHMKKIDK